MRRSLILIAAVSAGTASLYIHQMGHRTGGDQNIQWTEWDLRVSTTSVSPFYPLGGITIYPGLFTQPSFFGAGPGEFLFGQMAVGALRDKLRFPKGDLTFVFLNRDIKRLELHDDSDQRVFLTSGTYRGEFWEICGTGPRTYAEANALQSASLLKGRYRLNIEPAQGTSSYYFVGKERRVGALFTFGVVQNRPGKPPISTTIEGISPSTNTATIFTFDWTDQGVVWTSARSPSGHDDSEIKSFDDKGGRR